MIYKNEALRTRNRDLYAGYLADNYPIEMQVELADFDSKNGKIIKMTNQEA